MHLKLLIIEDCEDDAILLVRYLKSCGFDPKWQRVDRKEDLAEAVEDRRWDLVLCDYSMPRLTPHAAVDCVRQLNPDLPFILFTGHISEQNALELIQHGIQDVVLKDDLPRLKSVINRELDLARHRREKATAERRLAAALENLAQGVALYDADAQLIMCNRQYKTTLDLCQDAIRPGLTYSKLLEVASERGQYISENKAPTSLHSRLQDCDKPTGNIPIEAQHHDGRWVEIQRHRTDDGGMVTVTTDITEAKRREDDLFSQAAQMAKINNDMMMEIQLREETEDALRESEHRARAIFDNAVDGVLTFNEKLQIETVNPAIERIFGYSAEELKGRHIHHLLFLGAITSEDMPTSRQHPIEKSALDAKGLQLVTGWRKNGDSFPIELTISPIKLSKGNIYTGIIRDVTERTKLDRLKSEFVSVVSHELRTPLTSIRGALALLNTKAVGEMPERALNMISIGLQNSERLMRLINDILDIEKIESGKLDFSFTAICIQNLLDAAKRENQSFLDQMKVSLQIENSAGPDIMVRGDQGRLMQVLTNLISNAAKYSSTGGTVKLGADTIDNRVRVWVKDDGPGIPDSYRHQIFQKFSQFDASDTRQKGGTGLGLSIAKAIIDNHDGAIDFYSSGKDGTTFFFELRILDADSMTGMHLQSA